MIIFLNKSNSPSPSKLLSDSFSARSPSVKSALQRVGSARHDLRVSFGGAA